MDVVESLRVAIRGLSANKLRSSLTMLGMIIGIGAVIALLSIGNGAQIQANQQLQSLGSNLLFVYPGAQRQGGIGQQTQAPTLTYEDALAIANPANVTAEAMVAPEFLQGGQIIYAGQNSFSRIDGVTPEYLQVRNGEVAEGDFITSQNVDASSLVVVLGANVATNLFNGDDPVGQKIKISPGGQIRIDFTVIGVMAAKGGSGGFGASPDDMVYIPITTMQKRLFAQRTSRGSRNISQINIQLTQYDDNTINEATQQINDLLLQRHRVNQPDFTIMSQKDILSAVGQITGIFTVLLGSIAAISLVVGGIGIMNIMLVSVTERTREIGIRKAIGAKRRDVLAQFLIEAIVVSILGGIVGIALGAGISFIISQLDFGGTRIPSVVTTEAISLAVGVSISIGLFFGIYPAMRASQLNPIDALRYE